MQEKSICFFRGSTWQNFAAVVYFSTPFALLYPLIGKLTIFETMGTVSRRCLKQQNISDEDHMIENFWCFSINWSAFL